MDFSQGFVGACLAPARAACGASTWLAGPSLQPARYRRHRFASKYTPADVELLAAVDEAHETLSGPATRKILEREYQQYKQSEFERLAGISVAHLYRLRRRSSYRQRRLHLTKTRNLAFFQIRGFAGSHSEFMARWTKQATPLPLPSSRSSPPASRFS